MKEKKQLNLTEGSIYKVLIAFILPIMLGSLIQQLYTTIDAVIVGQFTGKEGLAAIDSVHTLFRFPINFMNGLASGATILIAGYFGANDRKGLRYSIRTAYTVAMILGLICTVLGVIFTPWLLHVMSVPKEIYPKTLIYSRIYFAGIWTLIIYNMTAGMLRALGDSKRPLYVLILSSIVNIVGDLLLVGVFHLGVQGAAIATVIAQVVSVFCTYHLLAGMECMEGHKEIWKPYFHTKYMLKIITTGFPLALQALLFPVANSIVQASVNGMGTDSIAAWGICEKLNMLIWLISDSMAPVLTTYVAQNLGARKMERVKKGVLLGTLLSVGAVCVISACWYVGSGFVGTFFVPSKDAHEIMPLVVRYMRLMAPFFLFYSIAEALSGACCGLGDTLRPMLTTLITICLLRVVAILFVLPSYHTMECIVWIYITSWIAAGLSFILMYRLNLRKLKKKI